MPLLQNLKGSSETWHAALLYWFAGRVLTEENRRYIHNFLCVTRARPDRDINDDAVSDEQLDDEDLAINKEDFYKAVSTKIGREREDTEEGAFETQEAKRAFDIAKELWSEPRNDQQLNKHEGAVYDKTQVAAMLQGAQNSKKNQFVFGSLAETTDPSFNKLTSESIDRVQAWLHEIRSRTKDGKPYLTDAQYEIIEKVAHRIIEDIICSLGASPGAVQLTEPLLWCMAGCPGVGKSEVILC